MEGSVDFERFLPILRKWFDKEMAGIYKSSPFIPDNLALLMGTPLWGEQFIKRFFDFCVPSLLAGGNISALKGACRLVLFTAKEDFDQICAGVGALENAGIEVEIHFIPKHIMKIVGETPYNKYWLLGTVQQLCLQIARRKGMGFHMLMPDHLYSEAFFSNLFRLAKDHQAIAQTTISGDVDACMNEIEAFRAGDAIAIAGEALGGIVYRNMHKQNYRLVMNGRDLWGAMPDSHFYFWVGKDRLHIHCCHMNVTYLSPRLVFQAPVRLHNALDTELPAYMPDEVYMPMLEDKMVFTELSDDTKGGDRPDIPLPEWACRVWATVHFRKPYMRFMGMKNVLPIPKQYDYAQDSDIDAAQAALMRALDVGYDDVKRLHDELEQEFDEQTKEAA